MKVALNLLPPVYRRQLLLRRRTQQWIAILCLASSSIFVARWYKVREYRALSQQLAAVSREGRPAQDMVHEITNMRQQIQQLEKRQVIAQELDQQRQVLSLLGAISQAARQTNGRLRVSDCRVVDLQATDVAAGSGTEALRPGTVTLVGISLDSPTVAECHDALLRSGLFADVRLIKSNEREAAGLAMYEYEVCCEL